jgi:hypothetical protein
MPPRSAPRVPAARTDAEPSRVGRLALIVLCCFGVGLAWPLFAGLDFVQRPPGSVPVKSEDNDPPPPDGEPDSKPSETPKPVPGVVTPAADVVRAAAHLAPLPPLDPGVANERREVSANPSVVRSEGSVVSSCRDGRRTLQSGSCDNPALEGSFAAAFANLGRCGMSRSTAGVLSLGLDVDFKRGRVTGVRAGQSTTLPRDAANALLACAKKKLLDAGLERVQHNHEAYSVYFQLRVAPPGSTLRSAPAPSATVTASGQATVASSLAVVRDGASLDARMLQRLQYGARVSVTGRRGDWYRINYDGHGATGWVHRKALGL